MAKDAIKCQVELPGEEAGIGAGIRNERARRGGVGWESGGWVGGGAGIDSNRDTNDIKSPDSCSVRARNN